MFAGMGLYTATFLLGPGGVQGLYKGAKVRGFVIDRGSMKTQMIRFEGLDYIRFDVLRGAVKKT
jgi:hypothetical protein